LSTQDPKQLVSSWRDEILLELAEAQEAIPPLQAAYEAATAAADEAATAHRDLQQLLAKVLSGTDFLGVTQYQYLEGPIGLRANDYATEVDRAKSQRARALADLEAVRAKVTSLRRAIAQIDRIVPAESEEAA
jgi:hypothetical protein